MKKPLGILIVLATFSANANFEVGTVPYFVNGEIEGMTINLMESSSPLNKLGIRKGDVVLTVDGRRINRYERARWAYLHSTPTTVEIWACPT